MVRNNLIACKEMKPCIISWVLLSFIVIYLLIPAIPVIDYLLNRDYIAKNLCVNKDKPKSCCKGKCHLVKQLNKTNNPNGNDKKELPKRLQLKELQDFILCKGFKSLVPDKKIKVVCSVHFRKSELHLNRVYIPPEA